MTCPDTSPLLSPYLDAQLPGHQARAVEAHLRACAACREELAGLQLAARAVASLPAPALRIDLAPRVVARAAAFGWSERWAALRDLLAPAQQLLVREWGRAFAIVALFLLAAMGQGAVHLLMSWPLRVAGAAEAGTAYVAAGWSQAQTLLDSWNPVPAQLAPTRRREKQGAARDYPASSIEIASHPQEVGHHEFA
jgi:anti-sigma factor RsiW